jgi:ubiquinone/menaquinone biosynthesis C-methylase UbiE
MDGTRGILQHLLIFRMGTETNIPCEDCSADLVTASMAIHWFDLDGFYAEVDRILRPGGCLAIYNYNIPVIFYRGRKAEEASNAFAEVCPGVTFYACAPRSRGPSIKYLINPIAPRCWIFPHA